MEHFDLPAPCPGRAAYFISDMHLGARYLPDRKAHERRVVEFLEGIEDECGVLFIVGDALDYWYEYRNVVPRGHVRFFGQLARMADRGISIVWLTGNHDIWLFDYLRDEIGLRVVDDSLAVTLAGKHFFIAHGDRQGRRPWTMRALGHVFRNKFCQRLYAAVHPRWTVGFAMRWSAESRDAEQQEYSPRSVLDFARKYVAEHPSTDYIVLGHHHRLMQEPVGTGLAELVVLGDWLRHPSYAKFDGEKLELCHFESTG